MHEVGRINIEGRGQLEDVMQRQVPLAALDLPDEGPMQRRAVGKRLLAEAEGATPLTNARSECLGGGGDGGWHDSATTYVPAAYIQSG